MSEKPILFSGEMVRAILDGRKTQTRRVVSEKNFIGYPPNEIQFASDEYFTTTGGLSFVMKCPYGTTGGRLWVRETWQAFRGETPEEQARSNKIVEAFMAGKVKDIVGAAQELCMGTRTGDQEYLYAADFGGWAYSNESDLKPWRPSIFMPRAASRITLKVTGVRVERLQDISEEDAQAEGVDFLPLAPAALTHRTSYSGLWDKINGKKHPWSSNPWVWCIEFRRDDAR